MDTSLVTNLLAKNFVARKDVKAIQYPSGDYTPHEDLIFSSGEHVRIPWRRQDFEAHLNKRSTFGHYLLDANGGCKLFAFDVDLNPSGYLPREDPWANEAEEPPLVEEPNLRVAWLNRAHPARTYMKYQFRQVAHLLTNAIIKELKLQCAVAYSGAKGIHVYAFFGGQIKDGDYARAGAEIALDVVGAKLTKGKNFFALDAFPNLSIELYPKQSSLEGKDVGNLMRLPLGKNWRAPKEPTFFVDMAAPLTELRPTDPVAALTGEHPWMSP